MAGETGPTGATGADGIDGSRSAVIPFSIAEAGSGAYLSTNNAGEPVTLNFSGFGNSYPGYIQLAAGDWTADRITFDDKNYYGCAFIMPYDGTLRSIHVLFSTTTTGEPSRPVSL